MRSCSIARLLATAVLLPHILLTSPAADGLALSQLSASSAARVGCGGNSRCSMGQLLLRGGGRRRKAPADPDVEIPRKKARVRPRTDATAEASEASTGLAPSSPSASAVAGSAASAALGSPHEGSQIPSVAPSPCIKCGSLDHWYAAFPAVAAEKTAGPNGEGVAQSPGAAGSAGECWAPETFAAGASAEELGAVLRAAAKGGYSRTVLPPLVPSPSYRYRASKCAVRSWRVGTCASEHSAAT